MNLLVDQCVTRYCEANQGTIRDEQFVCAGIDMVYVQSEREGGSHRRTDACPAENIEIRTRLAERLVNAKVGAPERAPGASDEPHRLSRDKPTKSLHVRPILERYMVVHAHVALREPAGSAGSDLGAALMQENEASCRSRMRGEGKKLARIDIGGGLGGGNQKTASA